VYTGDGHVRLRLSGLRLADFDWFGARTNAPAGDGALAPTNSTPVLVTAERSRYHAGVAVFSGNVLVAQGTNVLSAGELTLKITPDLKLTNLLASGGVKVRQGAIVLTARELKADFDGTERNLPRVMASGEVRVCGGLDQGRGRGLGARLTYDGATGEAVLDGNPEVVVFAEGGPDPKKQRPPVLTRATQILWNLRDETVRTRGEYSIISLPADAAFPRDCD
jgi:lipopolysaccharide export system protein LptA